MKGVVSMDLVAHTIGERRRQLLHALDDRVLHFEVVGARSSEDQQIGRGLAVHASAGVVAARSHRDRGDIPDAYERSIGPRTHDDLAEFGGLRETAGRDHGDGELCARGRRLAAKPSTGLGGVLCGHGLLHIVDRDPELRHPLGIHADEHRKIEIAEHTGIADPRDAFDLVLDVDLGVVAQIRGIVPWIVRGDGHQRQNVRIGLGDGDTRLTHRGGQLRQRHIHRVLHVHGREILIAPDVEIDRQTHRAVAGVRRLVVQQPIETRELLFDGCGHGRGHVGGAGARIERTHLYGGRRDLRVSADRQRLYGKETEQRDDHGDHRSQHRTTHEQIFALAGDFGGELVRDFAVGDVMRAVV